MTLFRTLSAVFVVGALLCASTAQGEELLHYWDMDTLEAGVPTDVAGGVATSENGTVTLNADYGEPYAGAGNALVTAHASPNYLVADVHDGTATAMDFGTGDFSYSYWSYDDSIVDADPRGPRIFDSLSGTTTGIQLGSNGSGVFNYRMDDDAGSHALSNSTLNALNQADGVWTHIAVNVGRTTGNAEIFFDGISQGTYDVSGLSGGISPTQDMQIGVINNGGGISGAQAAGLDDLAFYSGLLSQDNITALAAGEITPLGVGAVPEPSTLVLLALSLCGIVALRRRVA